MKGLFETHGGWSSLILRLMLGIVFFPHGMQKLFGWFGGYGFAGTFHYFTASSHIPAVFAILAIVAESFGSIGLIVGCLTRIASFGIMCNMVVAIYLVHLQNGFFMNWSGQQHGEGFEYHLLAIAICVALIIAGGGKWSIDTMISSLWKEKKQPS